MKISDKLYRSLFIFVIVIFLSSFLLISVYNLWNIYKANRMMGVYKKEQNIRTILILPKNESYWNTFIQQFKAVSVNRHILSDVIFYSNIQELINAISLSYYANIDAVILCNIFSNTSVDNEISNLKKKNIFVVSLLNDSLYKNEDIFIGIDYYLKGKIVGEIIYDNLKKKTSNYVNMAIVNNPFYSSIGGTLEIKGITDFLKEHKINEVYIKTFSSDYGSFSAELIAKELVSDNNSFNVIYASNEIETFTLTQTVILSNKIDRFILIGSGSDQKLLKYQKEGIITALINDKVKNISEKLIDGILSFKKYGHAASYISTDFSIIK